MAEQKLTSLGWQSGRDRIEIDLVFGGQITIEDRNSGANRRTAKITLEPSQLRCLGAALMMLGSGSFERDKLPKEGGPNQVTFTTVPS